MTLKARVSGYKCLYCPERFLLVSDWAMHTIKELDMTQRKHCIACSACFGSTEELTKHTIDRVCHKKLPQFICAYCDERTGSVRRLEEHEKKECAFGIDQRACEDLFTKSQCDELDAVWDSLTV